MLLFFLLLRAEEEELAAAAASIVCGLCESLEKPLEMMNIHSIAPHFCDYLPSMWYIASLLVSQSAVKVEAPQ